MSQQTLALVVTTPPHNNFTATALQFVESVLQQKHTDLVGVFFYQDGVLNGSKNLTMPSDELQAIKQWQSLHKNYSLPLHLCITAAEKRGLTDDTEDGGNILPEFTISGLGELVELSNLADRVVQL